MPVLASHRKPRFTRSCACTLAEGGHDAGGAGEGHRGLAITSPPCPSRLGAVTGVVPPPSRGPTATAAGGGRWGDASPAREARRKDPSAASVYSAGGRLLFHLPRLRDTRAHASHPSPLPFLSPPFPLLLLLLLQHT